VLRGKLLKSVMLLYCYNHIVRIIIINYISGLCYVEDFINFFNIKQNVHTLLMYFLAKFLINLILKNKIIK
jgi:hypothetical protein